ncbi:MAG: putative colicin production protein [Pseudomonadota bacterium]|jgi:membrane protein required for colicin V production
MAESTWIDIVFVVVLLASTLLSFLRGLVQEVASLAIWVLALVGGSKLASLAAEPFAELLSEPIRLTLGFVLVFLLILLLGRLVSMALRELMKATGATVLDRLLGSLFGLARGLIIMAVLAVLAAMTSLPGQPAWTQSLSRPVLDWSIRLAAPWLPDFVASRVSIPK